MVTKEQIEKYWHLTSVSFEETFQDIGTRSVRLINSQEGRFTCKILDNWYTKDALTERLKIFDYLKEKKFAHTLNIFKTKEGNSFQEIGGKFVLLLEYVDGKPTEKSEENYKQLGRIMGTLNNFTDYNYPCLIPVDAIRPTWPEISQSLSSEIRAEFLTIANNLPDIDGLPNSLIHFEILIGRNNIQKPDGEIIFIDWDEAGRGATVLDPGYMLINGFVSEDLEFDDKNAKTFYKSYLATHPLTDLEKQRLFDASLFHALRYVVYDPEKRWKRIRWAVENRSLLESVYIN